MKTLAVLAIAISSCGVFPADARAQEPHVHGGYAACYAFSDWQAQQEAYRAGDVERWNTVMRPLIRDGRCWLTEDGAIYNVGMSEFEGVAMIQSPVLSKLAKEDPPRWAFVSLDAVEDS